VILSGSSPNTFSGATTVNDGRLELSKTAGVNALAGSVNVGDASGSANSAELRLINANQMPTTTAVSIKSDGLFALNGNNQTIGTLAMTGGNITTGAGTLTLGGNVTGNADSSTATIAGNLALGATRTFTVANGAASLDMDVTAVISGSGFGLNKDGAGTLALGGANTYTGGTTLTAGTLQLGAAGVIPDSGTFTFAGGTLNPNGNAESIGPLSLSGGGTITLDSSRQDITFSSRTGTPSGTLVLDGWSSTGDQVLISSFTFDAAGISFLNSVQFITASGTINGAYWRGDLGGALVPVPEPVNVALGAFGAGAVGVGIARRLMRRSKEAVAAASSRQG